MPLTCFIPTYRYLSDNFPKILSLTDSKGRTALHYAAVAESGTGSGYYKIVTNAVGAEKGFIQSIHNWLSPQGGTSMK